MSETSGDQTANDEAAATAGQQALRQVVDQIEMSAAGIGWDRPPALYALVPTARLLEQDDLPADVAQSLRTDWDESDAHLSAIAQETVSEGTLEEMLPRIEWPDSVEGAALTLERIVLPEGAQDEAPTDPEEAAAYAEAHPARSDIRVTVGVNRRGDSWCEVRSRQFDSRDSVGRGENLVPALVEALRMGFAD